MRPGQQSKPPCKFVPKSAISAFFRARSIYNSTSHGENTDLADLCYEFT